MSLASSSGDRVGSVLAEGAARVMSLTGASLVRGRLLGIVSVGYTRHPSKKYMPGRGMISWSGPVCATICPLRALYNPEAGIHMWDRACDQLPKHTGRLQGTGGSIQESICVGRLALPGLLGGDLFSATQSRTLVPI